MLSMSCGGCKERVHKELGRALAVPARCRFPDFMGNSKGFQARLCQISAILNEVAEAIPAL